MASSATRSTRVMCSRLFLFLGLIILTATGAFAAGDEAKRILALIDYIGGDYKNSVKDGGVINPGEYQEMSEFAARSAQLFTQLKAAEGGDKAGIEKDLQTLLAHIKGKSGENAVPQLAQQIKDRLIKAYNIVPYPRRLPSLASGKKIYDDNCAQCHGAAGKGDGPGRDSMNPKTPLPANFTDSERIGGLSPFKVFNTASFGIEGTAMASFAALSEEQRWQVAFYVFTLRFSDAEAKTGAALAQQKNIPNDLKSTAILATHSDEQMLEKLAPIAGNPEDALSILAHLRRGLVGARSADPLSIARGLMREAVGLYAKGAKEQAYQKSVDAYLDGYELAEPTLVAKDATLGRGIEAMFTQLRSSIKQGAPTEDVQKQHLELEIKLDKAVQLLAEENRYTGYYAFTNSALIIFREGLEAALILASIVATLRVMGAPEAIRYIHLGWILALCCGGLTWLATQTVLTLSGRHRETMEGFISVFAAVALFYVGYWLHTRSEVKRWHEFIQQKLQSGVSTRRILGLTGISFFAVYREAFELVLFYQALWMQNEGQYGPILWGLAFGLGLLAIATFAILKLGLKLPLKYFLGATGTLLYIMAFIFAGTGINQLQAAGWVPATPLDFPPTVPLLGIYPTMETLAAQGLLVGIFIATSLWMAHERNKAVA
ncbi:MAG: FTR1 family protein [Candidatus Binatia bacterium]